MNVSSTSRLFVRQLLQCDYVLFRKSMSILFYFRLIFDFFFLEHQRFRHFRNNLQDSLFWMGWILALLGLERHSHSPCSWWVAPRDPHWLPAFLWYLLLFLRGPCYSQYIPVTHYRGWLVKDRSNFSSLIHVQIVKIEWILVSFKIWMCNRERSKGSFRETL